MQNDRPGPPFAPAGAMASHDGDNLTTWGSLSRRRNSETEAFGQVAGYLDIAGPEHGFLVMFDVTRVVSRRSGGTSV
jgi:hypothetical protein